MDVAAVLNRMSTLIRRKYVEFRLNFQRLHCSSLMLANKTCSTLR